MPLLVHGEVTDPEVDIFDREAVFIDRVLAGLMRDFPALKIVFEHITTAEAVAFVEAQRPDPRRDDHAAPSSDQPQRDVRRGLEASCLLPARRQARGPPCRGPRSGDVGIAAILPRHRQRAAHADTKECACGCAGIFNAPFALESYAAVFEEEGALDRLEAFASVNGAGFYGLPLNDDRITLERGESVVPHEIVGVVPFHAGETLPWRMVAEAAE